MTADRSRSIGPADGPIEATSTAEAVELRETARDRVPAGLDYGMCGARKPGMCRAKFGGFIGDMARKLKSDRVLFITTILLVGLSIVMVYSASAVVALERTGRPICS